MAEKLELSSYVVRTIPPVTAAFEIESPRAPEEMEVVSSGFGNADAAYFSPIESERVPKSSREGYR